MKFVRWKGEIKYFRQWSQVYEAHQHGTDIRPSMDSVAFEKPCDQR